MLAGIKFFIERDMKKQEMAQICKALLLESFKQNQMVFDYGTIGNKFYIILTGSVNIWVPFSVPVEPDEMERRTIYYDGQYVLMKQIKKRISVQEQRLEHFVKFEKKYGYGDFVEKTDGSCSNDSLQCV